MAIKVDFYCIRRFVSSCALGAALLSGVFPTPAVSEFRTNQNVVLSSAHPGQPLQKAPSHVALSKKNSILRQPYRGWGYLVAKLRQDGVSENLLRAVYLDHRMPPASFIPFSLRPRETNALYSNFLANSTLQIGRNFLVQNKQAFEAAENAFKVNRHVIAAILLIETHAGRVTGKNLVIERLSRLASIGEPTNLLLNYRKLSAEDPSVTMQEVKARADYLEETFYPEVRALFDIARRKGNDILTLRGSSAGAFGMPQFLPSNFLKFGIDANRDGLVSLFHDSDAIWSTANFLSHFGWSDQAPEAEKRKVLWKYNHSDAYIDAALAVASRLP